MHQLAKLFLFIFLLTGSLCSFSQSGKYNSLLWEISGNGLEKSSYLYGTMHVSNKVAFHLGDSFFIALNSVDRVALESDPSTWLNYMLDSAYLEENGMLYRIGAYTRDFYRDAFKARSPERKQLSAALNFNSGMVNGMLYRNSRNNADYEEDTYLDMYIFQAGRKWGKEIVGLEDFMESNRLVRKSAEPHPDEKEEELLKNYQKLIRQGKNPREMLEDAYRNGDLDMVDSLQKILNPGINHQRYMLWERNRNMVQKLDSLIQSGSTVFAGVGAAHLAGDSGMIEMMQTKGYKLRPVTRLISELSREKRNDLEKTYVPQNFTTYSGYDKWFEVDLPGNFFEIPENKQLKVYFYPEMENGTTYSLTRLRTYSGLRGETPAYALSRIDSILYESIPGKILKQEHIVRNGYPGLDIVNRTRKGNYERYLILATALEYFIFKVSGTLEYLPDNNHLEQVFNSFQLTGSLADATELEDSLAGFSIKIPGTALREASKPALLLGSSEIEYQSINEQGDYYRVRRNGLHDFRYIEEDSFELNYMTDEFLESINLKPEHRRLMSWHSFPALYTRSRDSQNWVHLLHLIKGPHYFQLLTRNRDSSYPSDFFSLLSFTKPEYPFSFVEFEDTALNYCVVTPVKFAGWNARTFRREKSKEGKDQFGEINLFRNFAVLPSDERIFLGYQRLDKYFYAPSRDSMFRREIHSLLNRQSLHLHAIYIHPDSVYADFTVRDTNSSRCIMARSVLADDRVYLFGVNTDTLTGLSDFARIFFESFRSKDSSVAMPFYRNKADLLFEDLNGHDSLAKIYAIESLDEITFQNRHVPELIHLIESYKHESFGIEERAILLEKLGGLKHPLVMPFLEDIYSRSADTATLQTAVIRALFKKQNRKSIEIAGRYLAMETPLVSPSGVEWMFADLYDSIRLSRYLFPDLLDYVHYPEYKIPIVQLLAELVDSSFIKPRVYRKYKKELLLEAKDNLKRKMAAAYGDLYEPFDDEDEFSYYNDIALAFNPILLPFRRDKRVEEYFRRALNVHDDYLQIELNCGLLSRGYEINDTLIPHFAARDDTRKKLYAELKRAHRTDLFPVQYLTGESVARALLYDRYKIEASDSLEQIRKVPAHSKSGSGYIYVFKRLERAKENEWQIDYVGIIPESPMQIPYSTDIRRRNQSYFDEEELDKLLDELKEALRFEHRKRVVHENTYQRFR